MAKENKIEYVEPYELPSLTWNRDEIKRMVKELGKTKTINMIARGYLNREYTKKLVNETLNEKRIVKNMKDVTEVFNKGFKINPNNKQQ